MKYSVYNILPPKGITVRVWDIFHLNPYNAYRNGDFWFTEAPENRLVEMISHWEPLDEN